MLSSCETTKNLIPNARDSLVLRESQFDCGPKPRNIPSDEDLKTMSSADLFDLTTDYWLWGQRCDSMNKDNRNYFYCFKGDKEACSKLEELN